MADFLVCANFIPLPIRYSDFSPSLKAYLSWYRKRTNLPPSFAASFRSVCPSILPFSWFHSSLPAYSFYLSLNDSPYCTHHEDLNNAYHLLISCPDLLHNRRCLLSTNSFYKKCSLNSTIYISTCSWLKPSSTFSSPRDYFTLLYINN